MDILTCNKQGRQSVIVDRIGYDKEGHTVYTKLGNGTETTYTYDKQRERLQVINSLYYGIRILATKGFKGGVKYDKKQEKHHMSSKDGEMLQIILMVVVFGIIKTMLKLW